jgi:hypothetical protein
MRDLISVRVSLESRSGRKAGFLPEPVSARQVSLSGLVLPLSSKSFNFSGRKL